MQNSVEVITLFYLILCTYQDIKYRGVSIWILVLGHFWGLFTTYTRVINEGLIFEEILIAITPGIIMLIVSIVSSQLGMADGLLFIILGMQLNLLQIYLLLIISTSFLLISAVIMKCIRKETKQMPYIPFLMLSYICLTIIK